MVAHKELADHLHSIRLLIVALLIGLAGLAAVFAAAGGIREAASQASGTESLFLRLFTISPEDSRLPAFFSLVALLGPLLGIAFGFDAINGERASRTLPRLLSQPIYRDDVINGKFAAGLAAIGVVLGTLTVFVASVGLIRIGVVPSAEEVIRLLVYLAVSLVYVGFWLGLAMLFSVLLRRAATSALAALAAWLVFTLFFGLVTGILADVIAPVPEGATGLEQVDNAQWQQRLSRLSPSTLYEDTTIALLSPQTRTLSGFLFGSQLAQLQTGGLPNPLSLDQSLLIAWPQVLGLISLTLVAFAIAYVSFMRQEVRA